MSSDSLSDTEHSLTEENLLDVPSTSAAILGIADYLSTNLFEETKSERATVFFDEAEFEDEDENTINSSDFDADNSDLETLILSTKPYLSFDYMDAGLKDLIYWQNPIKTASVLITGLSLLIAIDKYSLIQTFSAIVCCVMLGAMALRLKVTLLHADIEDRKEALRKYETINIPSSRWLAQCRATGESFEFVAQHFKKAAFTGNVWSFLKLLAIPITTACVGPLFSVNHIITAAYVGAFVVPVVKKYYGREMTEILVQIKSMLPFFAMGPLRDN